MGVAAFESQFVYEDAWQGVFYVGIPTVVASALTPTVDRALGGHLTPNRASLLALFCELVVIVILTLAGLITFLSGFGQRFVIDALLMSLASIFAFRLLVVMAVSRHSLLVAAIPASIQTVAAAVLLSIYSGTTGLLLDNPLLRELLSRPEEAPRTALRRRHGTRTARHHVRRLRRRRLALPGRPRPAVALQSRRLGAGLPPGVIGHVAEGSRELEDFFEELGEDAIVPVTVLSVRRPGGEEKARFVLPMIHPGPMGKSAAATSPSVAWEADGLAFPPHATAGHDFNLVTEREVDPILSAAETAYQRLDYTDQATQSIRVEEGEATLTSQAFGDGAFLAATYSPTSPTTSTTPSACRRPRRPADDIDEILLADAHNCNDGLEGDDLGHIVPGSQRSFDMIYGASHLGDRLAQRPPGRPPLRRRLGPDALGPSRRHRPAGHPASRCSNPEVKPPPTFPSTATTWSQASGRPSSRASTRWTWSR